MGEWGPPEHSEEPLVLLLYHFHITPKEHLHMKTDS